MKNFLICLFISLTLHSYLNNVQANGPKSFVIAPQATILHLIDPFHEDFKYGINLPINFIGNLYFRVLNVSSYADKKLYVVFNFINDPNPVVVPATLTTGPGITKNIHGEYLAIETGSEMFSKVRFSPIRCRLFNRCPETKSIQIISFDSKTNKSQLISMSYLTKIFLSHPSNIFKGKEVLFEDYTPCSSSAECALGNCCYNDRCWSRQLVGQCSEDSSFQKQKLGNICSSHYECESLCCDNQTGVCKPHKSKNGSEILCNQASGAFCVDKTWCAQETVNDCRIIKTGTDDTGKLTCALFCGKRTEHGSCINHLCYVVPRPAIPVFNTSNPDCSTAIDPLTIIKS